MKSKENAAPVDQTGSGEGGQLSFDGVRLPKNDYTTDRDKTQAISPLLLRGSANAIPLQDLQMLTGLDGREIRRVIQRERQNGACICINNRDGYFLAESEAERDSCARSMFARARAVEQTARAIASAEVDHE